MIYTEAVQAVVLLAGALIISIGAFSRAGGWHAVMSGVNPAAISLIRPIGDPGVPWPGLLLGIPLLGFYYWCTNQSIVQRMLSAKNIDHARWGALFAGLLKLPVLFLIVLPGTCALLLFPNLPQGGHGVSDADLEIAAERAGWAGGGGIHRRHHGVDCIDAQFRFDADHDGCRETVQARTCPMAIWSEWAVGVPRRSW